MHQIWRFKPRQGWGGIFKSYKGNFCWWLCLSPTSNNVIQYLNNINTGNVKDFGDLTASQQLRGAPIQFVDYLVEEIYSNSNQYN
jgi:hypothetical protein